MDQRAGLTEPSQCSSEEQGADLMAWRGDNGQVSSVVGAHADDSLGEPSSVDNPAVDIARILVQSIAAADDAVMFICRDALLHLHQSPNASMHLGGGEKVHILGDSIFKPVKARIAGPDDKRPDGFGKRIGPAEKWDA